jgi:hypothetical protein
MNTGVAEASTAREAGNDETEGVGFVEIQEKKS